MSAGGVSDKVTAPCGRVKYSVYCMPEKLTPFNLKYQWLFDPLRSLGSQQMIFVAVRPSMMNPQISLTPKPAPKVTHSGSCQNNSLKHI